ncbi:hypothetical protein WA026_014994, partial [Henosepilachna vigintioctopunctata]
AIAVPSVCYQMHDTHVAVSQQVVNTNSTNIDKENVCFKGLMTYSFIAAGVNRRKQYTSDEVNELYCRTVKVYLSEFLTSDLLSYFTENVKYVGKFIL